MRVLKRIQHISTLRRPIPNLPLSLNLPPVLRSEPEEPSSRVFDPDDWPLMTWKMEPTPSTSDDVTVEDVGESVEAEKKKAEIVEENRSDGHAPIKTALSVLMQGLQKSSSMSTSLSDIDVTLFNFHSTKFAERLLNRNVSSLVIVESSHVFSKNAKKFAEKVTNASAYRADIYTLMGVGRKKTTRFPKKLMFSGFGTKKAKEGGEFDNIRPLQLGMEEEEGRKVRRPHLVAVLPTPNIQKTIMDSMIQHALLHHSRFDDDTLFRYGNTNLLTFLSCGTLSQYLCSTDPRLHFLSHQHRRHSALFDKLFELKPLLINEDSPIGHPSTSFHPQLPSVKRITHEKKLAEVPLRNGMQYAVQIAPRTRICVDGNEVTEENGMGKELVPFGCFMGMIGKQQNAKTVGAVVRTLWPETALGMSADMLTNEKIGEIPLVHLESIFTLVKNELVSSPIAQSYSNELKIKRVV